MPPSTEITCPVIQEDFSVKRNEANSAISLGSPTFKRGFLFLEASSFSSEFISLLARGVLVRDGAIQLTLTLGASSAANEIVRP